MEPLGPNDPLWKLLGKSRPVEVRGSFVPDVVRSARQVAQDKGWLAALSRFWRGESFPWLRPAVLACGLLLVFGWISWPESSGSNAVIVPAVALEDAEMALIAEEVDLALEGLEHMDALVAMEDTSSLSDSEIAFLLY